MYDALSLDHSLHNYSSTSIMCVANKVFSSLYILYSKMYDPKLNHSSRSDRVCIWYDHNNLDSVHHMVMQRCTPQVERDALCNELRGFSDITGASSMMYSQSY